MARCHLSKAEDAETESDRICRKKLSMPVPQKFVPTTCGSPFNLSISSDYRSNKRISFEHQRSLKFSCDHEQPTASSLEQQLGKSTNGYVAILAAGGFCLRRVL